MHLKKDNLIIEIQRLSSFLNVANFSSGNMVAGFFLIFSIL